MDTQLCLIVQEMLGLLMVEFGLDGMLELELMILMMGLVEELWVKI